MPECFRLNLYARVAVLRTILHTRPRVQRAPGIPCSLFFERDKAQANLGYIVPRERGFASDARHRHCERSEAIHGAACRKMDCFVADAPRNDVEGAGHDNQICLTPANTPLSPQKKIAMLIAKPVDQRIERSAGRLPR